MSLNYLEEIRKADQKVNNLFAFMGMLVTEIGPDRAVLTLPFRTEFLQGAGGLAGGVIAMLIDEAMAHVVIPNLGPGEGCVTVELSVRYLNPAPRADIRAEARVVKRGSRLVFVECDVLSTTDALIARGQASFMILARR